MDSEHIKTQYLSLSMFVVLPMQHISLRGLGGGMSWWLTWESRHEAHMDIFFFFLAQYILFHLSFTALRLHDRVDLCKDHLSLHGITIFFACWDLLGLQGDYFIFLTPPRKICLYLFHPSVFGKTLNLGRRDESLPENLFPLSQH